MKAASSTGWLVTGRAGGMGQGWRLGQGSSEGRPPSPTPPTDPWGLPRGDVRGPAGPWTSAPLGLLKSPLSPSSCPPPPRAGAGSRAGNRGQERGAKPPPPQVSRCLACSGGNGQH